MPRESRSSAPPTPMITTGSAGDTNLATGNFTAFGAVNLSGDPLLAYQASFTDGSQGIYAVNITAPEPGSAALILMSAVVFGERRRARRRRPQD